ncbi:MAG: VWA domain-containing protein [Candidatus Sulfotelmatobacter sp.]
MEQSTRVATGDKTGRGRPNSLVAPAVLAALLAGCLSVGAPGVAAQSSGNPASGNPAPDQPAQTQPSQTQPAQNSDIPDAPAVQPSAAPTEPPPVPKPEEKKPATVERDPWTNQPINKPANTPNRAPNNGSTTFPGDETSTPPPPMPPVRTLPPGTSTKPGQSAQEQLYTLHKIANFVQIPVTVKTKDGRAVEGLESTDFVVKENGAVQKLSFFTADPFALSVAIVLDLGMPDAAVQKINQTFPALVGAFAPYDEVAFYTYSSTVSEVTDFTAASQKLSALLNQMKTERGRNNGVPVMSGPLAPNGPIINGVPVGSPTEPVYTPPKESHVLNDAVLRAAVDLRKRDRARRKIIFVISDGREFGSQASFRDVRKVLLSNEIEVIGVAVDSGALPIYDKIEHLHLPDRGYNDILPRYAVATGGAVYAELTRNTIENAYSRAMDEARNQYTLGYTPTAPKTPTAVAYHSIEVLVDRPGLKVVAKDGYYPAIVPR